MKHLEKPHPDLKKGIFLALLGWLSISTVYMLTKFLGDQTSIPTVLFFRNFIGILIVLPWIFFNFPHSVQISSLKKIILRAILSLLNLCFMFLAVRKISLVNATLLSNSAPFFVPFIIWLWHKIPINHKLWPIEIIGFMGIFLVLKPTEGIFNTGSIYALLSGLCFAMILVLMRELAHSENIFAFMFYFCLFGGLLSLPFAFFYWKIESGWTLLSLIVLGALASLSQFFSFYALRYAKSRQVAPFMYGSVIFSGIYEWILWDRQPHLIAYVGIILVISSGAWLVYVNRPQNTIT